MLRLTLPRSDRHTQVKIILTHDGGSDDWTYDDSHNVMDLKLPEGVDIGDVTISAQFLDRNGEPDASFPPMTLKEKVPSAPKVEPCDAPPAPEPTDGDANDGQEVAIATGGKGITDAEQAGGSSVEQEVHPEPVKEVTAPQAEAVVALSFDVPVIPPAPKDAHKSHHKPRVPAHK